MRKADGTEATLTKHTVEMASDIKEWKPLEPKELVDREPGEKEITDPRETVSVLLKLSNYKEDPEDWFSSQWYDVLKKKDGSVFLYSRDIWSVETDIVKRCMQILYWGKYAYLKKWEFELYWPVDIKRYVRKLATPYGYITIPIITVDNTAVLFDSHWCLSEWERATYELYNNKTYDYDKMELEKKIMGDLILYSTLWTKDMEQSRSVFDKIKKECENTGVLRKITFKDWVFTLDFDWRIWFDTANHERPMVFPPFTVKIDFVRKSLWLSGWHPHRWQGGFCLGWELTKIRDRCFRDKDIYGLVMWMVQFWQEWNSSDVGHWDRHPWRCIMNAWNDWAFSSIDNLPVSKAEILFTVMEASITYVLDNTWLSQPLKDLLLESEWFRKQFKERVSHSNRETIIETLLSDSDKKKDFIKELLED